MRTERGRRMGEGGWDLLPLSRAGLTLVELLVAISIIAILSALLLGVASRAGDTARAARTKQLIARLHTLVQERYESYQNRRVELDEDGQDGNGDWRANLTTPNTGIQDILRKDGQNQGRQMGRLAGVRELMKLEMPDRWSDIVGTGLPSDPDSDAPYIDPTSASFLAPLFLRDNPSLQSIYLRKYNEIADDSYINTETGLPNTARDLRNNQGAECLYLIVMNATADGEARGLFKETDVGDTDGDGALEFLDGWGNAIQYLRWAPGFESDLQVSFKTLARLMTESEVTAAITTDPDPLDLFRVDQPLVSDISINSSTEEVTGARGWRILPLIYSAGSDEGLGIRADSQYVAAVDPYVNDTDTGATGSQRLGEDLDDGEHVDNIHNHLISSR